MVKGHHLHTACKIDWLIVMRNFTALRAAVFHYLCKNLKGEGADPPPIGARVQVQKTLASTLAPKKIFPIRLKILGFG